MNYLQHKTTLTELVDWAEKALMEGEIQEEDSDIIRDIPGRLGLADVKQFGLYWEDFEDFMRKSGYILKVDAGLVA